VRDRGLRCLLMGTILESRDTAISVAGSVPESLTVDPGFSRGPGAPFAPTGTAMTQLRGTAAPFLGRPSLETQAG